MMRGRKLVNRVEHDFDDYLPMIEQAQQLDDLPVIRVELKRPIITLRFIILLPVTVYWVFSVAYRLITDFDRELLIFVVISFVLIAFLIDDYYKLNFRLFNPMQQDIYYCELTPKHFKWVFNEQVKEILWHDMMFMDKFMASQYDYAHIKIYLYNSQLGKNDIILYDAHLPCSYRTLYKIIVEYREKHRQLVISSI